MIELSNLTFRRTSFTLGPVTLSIRPGEITCLLGPNGSGKTTLLHLMLGRLLPAGGQALLGGADLSRRRKDALGVMNFTPDEPDLLIDELSATEYWDALLALSGVERTDQILARREAARRRLSLTTDDRPIGAFSHGMRKKAAIIAAMQDLKPVWVLDEPRNGLDPFAARELERILTDAAQRGVTVLVTTHDLLWAERIAKRVVMLVDGTIISDGSVEELRSRSGSVEAAFFDACDTVRGGTIPHPPTLVTSDAEGER